MFGHKRSRQGFANRIAPLIGAPLSRTTYDSLKLAVAILGRENAGKTALLTALDLAFAGEFMPSGLKLNLMCENAQPMTAMELNSRLDRVQQRLWEMSEYGDGLKTTLHITPARYCICEGEAIRAEILTNDEIGQVMSHIRSDSPVNEQRRHAEFKKRLSTADIVTVMLSPPRDANDGLADFQWKKDVKQVSAHLEEAIRSGNRNQPVVVPIVISKIDTIADSPEDAQHMYSDERVLVAVNDLVQTVRSLDRVSHSAIIPVSTIGFGNATMRSRDTEEPEEEAVRPWHQSARAFEPEFGIAEGRTLQPYNLRTLILWSVFSASLTKEVELVGDEVPALARACQKLGEDLHATDGWWIPVKG